MYRQYNAYNMFSDKMHGTATIRFRFSFFLNHTAIVSLPEGFPVNMCSWRFILLFLTGSRERKILLFPTVFTVCKRAWNHSRQHSWGSVGRTWKHSECVVSPRVSMVPAMISLIDAWVLLRKCTRRSTPEVQKQWLCKVLARSPASLTSLWFSVFLYHPKGFVL